MPRIIPPTEWSKDHWATIAYAFTCLGAGGRLSLERLRTDGDRYPTRLHHGGTAELRREPGHSDLDCLVDAEAAGVLVNVGTGLFPVVRFTDEGLKLGQWLCGAMDARTIRTIELTWVEAKAGSGTMFPGVDDGLPFPQFIGFAVREQLIAGLDLTSDEARRVCPNRPESRELCGCALHNRDDDGMKDWSRVRIPALCRNEPAEGSADPDFPVDMETFTALSMPHTDLAQKTAEADDAIVRTARAYWREHEHQNRSQRRVNNLKETLYSALRARDALDGEGSAPGVGDNA